MDILYEYESHESIIDIREFYFGSFASFCLTINKEKRQGSLLFGIKRITPDAFEDLPNLECISICFADSVTLEVDFIDCQALENLKDLQMIELNNVDREGYFTQTIKLNFSMKHLKHLTEVTFNGFEVDMDTLKHLKKLKSLNLERCKLVNLNSDSFAKMKRLNSLILSECGLKEIPLNLLAPCSNLVLLHLNDNQITELREDTFKNLALLENLTLSENAISTFANNLFKSLINLKSLEISILETNQLDGINFDDNKKLSELFISKL